MKLKYKLALTCLAIGTIFVSTDIANAPKHQFEVAQRGMI
ncbi:MULTISPECIES: PhrC/PhrF family phosphatase-inhibitory pheromone [Bacillus]|nr:MULTISPECIES: PhrC/PhrF family phosphatase-inhibitory pheromone [Bacillus]NER66928.1 PhrC/PhrF family phosphatase-inhibitory pheromone [Bacillus velezensis]OXS82585.1 phosphatase [Bacillus sp. LYLB4]QNQ49870.1 PhrC/PhrF family phosphatase-inhibitory pheromone [Bacillus velezensis]QTG84927.1 PhrC/PhrF family phosphatase-inhibitory pheromone [Bacillus amyloliquefaciens]